MNRLPFFVVISAVTFLLAACEPPENATGKQLFEHYCATCHKDSGKGKFLKGIPSNLHTDLSTAQIVVLIKHGKREFKDMPAFQDLTQEQAVAIADYLKYELPRAQQ